MRRGARRTDRRAMGRRLPTRTSSVRAAPLDDDAFEVAGHVARPCKPSSKQAVTRALSLDMDDDDFELLPTHKRSEAEAAEGRGAGAVISELP